mgnify:CR=1 FL=1
MNSKSSKQCTLEVNIMTWNHRVKASPQQNLGLHVKTGAFWAKMINSKNFQFFLKFMMVAFFRLWSPKWSPHNCQYLGDQPQNLKNPCFSNLQVWISFKTSFSSFGLNKMTHGQISTYINGAFFGAPEVLQPKIPSKFEQNWSWTFFSQYKIVAQGLHFGLQFLHIWKIRIVSFHWKKN